MYLYIFVNSGYEIRIIKCNLYCCWSPFSCDPNYHYYNHNFDNTYTHEKKKEESGYYKW